MYARSKRNPPSTWYYVSHVSRATLPRIKYDMYVHKTGITDANGGGEEGPIATDACWWKFLRDSFA